MAMVLLTKNWVIWPFGIYDLSYGRIVFTTAVVVALSIFLKYRRGVRSFGGQLPGLRVPFIPLGLPGVLLPTTWWNPGLYCTYLWRKTLYKRFNHDTITIVPFIFGSPQIYTSNREVMKQTTWPGTKERNFHKPAFASQGLTNWGTNVVGASDGAEWRRHRRILSPAFRDELFNSVWSESISTYRQMLDSDDFLDQNEIKTAEVQEITTKFALTIIGRCGFGLPFDWKESMRTSVGKVTIMEALRMISGTYFLISEVPRWLRALIPTQRMRDSVESEDHALAFMKAQVRERRKILEVNHDTSNSVLGKDIFTMLVEANEKENAKFKLADDELISNVYVMLLAGHETTAHTLAATLGFLSVNQQIQKEVYDQIVDVVGDRDPLIDDMKSLEKVRNAFLEAMRLFPPVYLLIREAFEDTVLQVPSPLGSNEEPTMIPVPKGSMVITDMVGMQINPRYFESPEEYKPSRWEGVSLDSEAISAFSSGPRVCIGRKFAVTEAICFLTQLLRDFQIEPILNPGETEKEWTERVMDGHIFITLVVKKIPIKFVRRKNV